MAQLEAKSRMIPKPLSEVEWADIEALRDSGREEDDTIEYKGGFSGGSDFLFFNDGQRTKAVSAIGREVVAFLNGRGGDIIIGVKEAENNHPKIEAITPVQNVNATVDRLAQSLSAIIEPMQTVLAVRAVRKTEDSNDGVLIIRAPSSLRAPHRLSTNKECYIRRGRECVPMPMDEIQDVTLGRAMRRSERNALLDSLFVGMAKGVSGRRHLSAPRFSARMAYVPYATDELALSESRLAAMASTDPIVFNGENTFHNEVAFRNLDYQWRPILRGRQREGYQETENSNPLEFDYCRKVIRSDGVLLSEISMCNIWDKKNSPTPCVYYEWLVGFLANSLKSISDVLDLSPSNSTGVIRLAIDVAGDIDFNVGNVFANRYRFPVGFVSIPDFEIFSLDEIDRVFAQLQTDLFSLVGKMPPQVWSLVKPV